MYIHERGNYGAFTIAAAVTDKNRYCKHVGVDRLQLPIYIYT